MMSLKKQQEKSKAFAYKRLVIEEIKKFPQAWFHNEKVENNVIDDIYKVIHTSLNSVYSVLHLRQTWRGLRNYYIELLLLKTVKQNNTAPSWELFHDLSFLYEKTSEIVQQKAGGLSVPKFLPSTEENAENVFPCPCCLPVKKNHSKKIADKVKKSPKKISQNLESKADELTNKGESTKRKSEATTQIDLVSDTEEENFCQDYNLLKNQSIPGVPFIHCMSMLDKDDDFSFEELDKLKDYDREVLYFSDMKPKEAVCIDISE